MQPQYITLHPRAKDITNHIFGRLTALGPVGHTPSGQLKWLCRCECGNLVSIRSVELFRGHTQSCGCLRSDLLVATFTTHGMAKHWLYRIWHHAVGRCENPTDKNYYRYGGRGITIDNEWRNNFKSFYDHVSELPNFGNNGYTLDRINNDSNYEPGNVKWSTYFEQASNRRDNRLVTYNGKTQILSVWARELNMLVSTLGRRLQDGWTIKRAFETPARKMKSPDNKQYEYMGESLTLTEWEDKTHILRATLKGRLDSGWNINDAFNIPPRFHRQISWWTSRVLLYR